MEKVTNFGRARATTKLMEVNTKLISHIGTIKSINNQHLIVRITSQTACSSCHAKGSCSSSEQEDKEIEVQPSNGNFVIGEVVQVITTTSQGYAAVALAYLLPLILLVTILLTILSLEVGEAVAALGAIMILIPYYWLLFHYRDKIKSSFHFTVQKLPNIIIHE